MLSYEHVNLRLWPRMRTLFGLKGFDQLMTQFRALEKIAEEKIRQKQKRGLMDKIEKYDLATIGLESNVDMMESDLHELMHVYYKRHGVILYSKVFFSWHAVRWCCMIFLSPTEKRAFRTRH